MDRQPLPELREPLDFVGHYSSLDYVRLVRGLEPREMEDRWLVAFEAPWLYLYRSWTGFCVYGLRLEHSFESGASVVESWVSRDPAQYRGTSLDDDRAVARLVIEGLMLGRNVELPAPYGQPPGNLSRAIYEHATVGRIASTPTSLLALHDGAGTAHPGPSLRSRLVLFLLRHRHWFRLQRTRDVIDANTSIPALRARVERSSGFFGKLPADVTVTSVSLDGLAADWIRPVAAPADRTILYFHGGGYVMGSSRSHRAIVAKFARGSGIAALVFDYRLAPEHPFPAALDDAIAAYRWLLAQGHASDAVVFAGDSAGAGLCLAALLAIRERGLPLPAAAAVLSPWTDLTCSGASYARPDPLAPEGSWAVFGSYYAGTHDRTDPLVSPFFGDLRGLPPLLVYVGEDESMLDDSRAFAEKARRSGVDVRLEIGRGMVHCYPALAPLFPEATAALADVCRFLRERLGMADKTR